MHSRYIFRLRMLVQAFGWQVRSPATWLPAETAGQANGLRRCIDLNCSDAEDALCTLAHEVGHVIDYHRDLMCEQASQQRREVRAYLYGWLVLQFIGAHHISKETWRSYHVSTLRRARGLATADELLAGEDPTGATMLSHAVDIRDLQKYS